MTLKAFRVNIKMSTNEMAKKMETSEKTIRNWENGKTMIPADKFLKWCEVTGAHPSEVSL